MQPAAKTLGREPRTNMFVLATIASRSFSGPVKIRNLSEHGALLEGSVLPEAGEQLQIRRGDLSATGTVAWRRENRAGLALDQRVEVDDWMVAGHAGQQAVDRTFQAIKAAGGVHVENGLSSPSIGNSQASELRSLANAIDRLGSALVEDGSVVARHLSELQVLDIAVQTLRKIAATMG